MVHAEQPPQILRHEKKRSAVPQISRHEAFAEGLVLKNWKLKKLYKNKF